MINIGFIYAIGAAVIWGLVYALDQKILHDISPIALLFFQSSLSAIVVSPFLFLGKGPLKGLLAADRPMFALMIATVLLVTAANFLIFSGIKAMDASMASIIEIAYPFFVVLFSYFIFGSKPNVYFLIGGALVFIGSTIIIKFA